MRRPATSVYGLADVLEPHGRGPAQRQHHAPMVVTRPARVDFAFADTVHLNEIADDELPPASGPMIVKDETGHRRMNPLAFPPPTTRVRDATVSERARAAVNESVHEIQQLWASTDGHDAGMLDRLRAIWAFWQWDQRDVVRAAIIGVAVFAAVATVGVTLGH